MACAAPYFCMKKAVSVLLVAVIVCSLFILPVSALGTSLTCPNCGGLCYFGSWSSGGYAMATCDTCGLRFGTYTQGGGGDSRGGGAGRIEVGKKYYSQSSPSNQSLYNAGTSSYYSIHNTTNKTINYLNQSYTYNNYTYNNTYNYYTFNTTTNNYYVTNNYTYVTISYPVGDSGEGYEDYESVDVFYELPDGRNSFYCTVADVFGVSYLYNVRNADLVLEDDGKTLGLWHLDGNFYDSSNFGNHGSSGSYQFSPEGWDGSFLGSYISFLQAPLTFPYDYSAHSSSYITFHYRAMFLSSESTAFLKTQVVVGSHRAVFDVIPNEWLTIDIVMEPAAWDNDWIPMVFVNGLRVQTGTIPKDDPYTNGLYIKLDRSYFSFFDFRSSNVNTRFFIDEVRVSSVFEGNSESVFVPFQPYDSNMVFVYPDDAVENDVVIQSALPVTTFRVGGARPTYPANGTVFINVIDNVVTSILQYDAGAWKDVNAAIYTNGEWFNLMNFDLSPVSSSPEDIPSSGEDDGGSGAGGDEDFEGSVGGFLDTVLGIGSTVVNAVITLFSDIVGGITAAVPLFSKLASTLTSIYTFLPEEWRLLLTAGFSIFLFVGVIKLFFS